MWRELGAIFDALSTDPATRAIVLSGAGPRAFTTGIDVTAAASGVNSPLAASPTAGIDAARQATAIRNYILSFQACVSAIERCTKPVACALHGLCLGLAVDVAVTADLRFCAADSVFSVKEVDIGLAADVGTLSRLPKVVGDYGWVKDVCLSAREFRAEEAERVGFVRAVLPDKARTVEAAMAWARIVAEKSPVAVQGTKALLDYSRDHTVEDGQ